MTFIHMYFGTRSPSSWNFEDFKKYYTSSDVASCWFASLESVRDYKNVGQEHKEAALKLIELIELIEKRNIESDSASRKSKKRSASIQGQRGVLTRNADYISKISSWKASAKQPWAGAPFVCINTLPADSMKLVPANVVRAFNGWKAERKLALDNEFQKSKEFDKVFQDDLRLSTLIKKAYPDLEKVDFKDISPEEQDYIWSNIFWQKWLWRVYSEKNTAMEGWLITFVYGHLMSILLEVPETLLMMTERKMADSSVAFNLQKLTCTDYRHDGLLRIEGIRMDVMAMEAKPTPTGSEDDLRKLGIVLSNNILGMKKNFPSIRTKDLRTFGIMFVNYEFKLIEVRLVDETASVDATAPVDETASVDATALLEETAPVDETASEGIPVLFTVAEPQIPKEDHQTSHDQLISSLKMFIAFKRKIQKSVELMIHHKNGNVTAILE